MIPSARLYKDNKKSTDRRTRVQVDKTKLTKVGLGDDNGFEAGEEVSKEKEGAPAQPWTRSPQRDLEGDIEEDDEDDEDEEEREYWEDEDDEGTDEDEDLDEEDEE